MERATPRSVRRMAVTALLTASALALSACGTTVPLHAGSASGGGIAAPGALSGGTPAVGPTGAGPSDATGRLGSNPALATGGAGPAGTGTRTGGAGAAAGGAGVAGGAATGAGPAAGPVPRASAASGPIEIGFMNLTAAQAGQYGINQASGHTTQQTYQAIVDAINAHGGLDGRRIVPVYANISLTGDWATDYQAACATFTQDHHVAAVLGYSLVYMDTFEACLTHAGVVNLSSGSPSFDNQDLAQNPYMFTTAYPTTNAVYLSALSGGVETGLLTKGSKIGVIRTDCGFDQRAWAAAAAPFIAAHQLDVVKTATLSCPSNAADVGAIEGQMPNIVLQFHTAGVDVVFGTGYAQYFADDANTQGYYPQYLITTVDTSEGLQTQNVPAQQMQNMHGFGWYPILDADPQHQPATPAGQASAQARCLALFKSQGYTPTSADLQQVYDDCDTLFLYGLALKDTGGQTAARAIAAAVSSLGGSYPSATALAGADLFTSSRHDGPDRFAPFGWNGGCSCFVYTGAPQPMPAGS